MSLRFQFEINSSCRGRNVSNIKFLVLKDLLVVFGKTDYFHENVMMHDGKLF